MPAYLFVEDILLPFLKRPVKFNTARAYAKCAKPLEQFFAGMYCTDSRRSKKKIIDGVKVTQYREWRKLNGISIATIKLELSVACAACNWAVSEMNFDFRNVFLGRTVSD